VQDEVKDLINIRFDRVYDPQASVDYETVQAATTKHNVTPKRENPVVRRESPIANRQPRAINREHEANGTVSTTSAESLPVYDDAKLAARLQAEENGRARPTRGIAQRKIASSAKSSPKKKNKERSARKVKHEGDSGIECSTEAEVKKTGAFHVSPSAPSP